jgi:lipoprotein-releasing system permease protein
VYCNLEWLQKIRGMLVPDERPGSLYPGQSVSVRADGRDLSGYIAGFQQDGAFVAVNLDAAQAVSGQIVAPRTDVRPTIRSITSIQIKLKNFDDAPEVVQRLQAAFRPGWFSVRTWEQKQGPLLAAVEVESAILNVLLFLIIAVAGFGILAIFFMIVVEKTRDIGILKALGASSGGVMSIFLSYGLALGVVGSGVGVVLGLLFVRYINTIEGWITWLTGRKVFDEKIYYFPEIPTSVSPLMVIWVAVGAMGIAVLASVLPARRAARLHPVRALRYE